MMKGKERGDYAASYLPFSGTQSPPLPISVSSLTGPSGDSEQILSQLSRGLFRPGK